MLGLHTWHKLALRLTEREAAYTTSRQLACQGLAEAEGNQGLVAYADADNFQTGNYAYTARTLHLGCIELTS
eukprot:scaffold25234_cov21-Tisochrysis_lutea.AAC.1